MFKVCSRCKTKKPSSCFGRDKRRTSGLRSHCNDCRRNYRNSERGQESRKRERPRPQNFIKWRYGVTPALYNEMLERQHHVCAICKMPETLIDRRTGKVKRLAVDHCHTTGKVRGLLCFNCNSGLGHFRDSSATLRGAISYLETP